NRSQRNLFALVIIQDVSHVAPPIDFLQTVDAVLDSVVTQKNNLLQAPPPQLILHLLAAKKLDDRIFADFGVNGQLESAVACNQGIGDGLAYQLFDLVVLGNLVPKSLLLLGLQQDPVQISNDQVGQGIGDHGREAAMDFANGE